MPERGKGKWQALLADKDVKRWYDNLARGSRATADNYVRVLGRFLAPHRLTPDAFVKLPPKRRDDLLSDTVTAMLDAGKAPSYVEVTKKAAASWLDWNGLKLTRKIKISGSSLRPSLRDAHIPSQEELRQVLHLAPVQAKTAIALMAFSGARPEVMGSYLGTDGLRLENFVEAKVKASGVTFETVPTLIEVPERLSKTGRPYFTFLGPEGVEYLSAYLGQRARSGEDLTPKSPLITPKKAEKPFIRALNIGHLIRKPMRAGGLKEPPYIWRSYFASRAMLAEGKGLTRDYRQFMMGHKGDIEHVYALHKKLLPDTVEAMRKGYEAALEYLETAAQKPREDPTLRMVSVFLKAAGYTEDEVAAMDLSSKTEEEIVGLLKSRRESKAANENGARQRIVPMERLDTVLAEGWTYKDTLPDGRAIVEIR